MFHAGLATVAFSGVRVPEGLASSERGMEIADRLGLKPVWAACALLRAGALKLAGRLAESRALFRAAHALADAADDVRVAFYAITNLADWTEGYEAGDGRLLEAELQRPRNATASVQRDTLLTDIGSGQARNGRLAEARRMLALVPPGFLQSQMDYYDGAWERCLDSLADGLEILRDVGNRSAVANRLDHIASVRYALDDLAGTAIALAEQLEIAIDGSAALLEVRARAELALVSALRGDCQAAEEHLRRGREIIANGEDWGRKGGRLCLAGAITSVLVGDIDRARREIEAALAVFRSRRLPWDAADAHVQYARQLEAAGLTAEACPHRDAAVEIYRGLGAPPRWTERALAPAVRS
jgi:tetratricopeptide (TPR) repeat protein